MRRQILILALAALAFPSIARANVPSPKWQQDALSAALNYWQTQGHTTPWLPGCQMTVTYAPLPDLTEAGETDGDCNIVMNSSLDWIDPVIFCLDVTHEVGHVMLGPDAFPNNPSDPAHSSDPNNIMYPVIFNATTPQCTAMLNKEYPPLHHRKKHPRKRASRS